MGLSSEQLHQVLQEYGSSPQPAATDRDRRNRRTEEERKELKEWMETKRRERSREFRRNMAELRGTEKKPFEIKGMVSVHNLVCEGIQ